MTEPDFDAAVAAHRAGRLDEAEKIYKNVLVADAAHADAWHLLGLICYQRGNDRDATTFIEKALTLAPDVANFHNSAGLVFHRLGQQETAERHFTRAIKLGPADAEPPNNMGLLLADQRRYADAETYYRQALALRPDYAGARHNLSRVLVRLGRPKEALALSETACALSPDNADFVNCLGIVRRELGDLDGAAAEFRRAISLDANCVDAHVGLAHALLLHGNFKEGWVEHEWRLRRPEHAGWPEDRRWNGSGLEGKTVLLWAEQGYGDVLQFVRYVACVRARGADRIILAVQPALQALLQGLPDVSDIVTNGDNVHFDLHCPLMSLPYFFYKESGPLAESVPYLTAGVTPLSDDTNVRVGLVWAGNPHHANDRHRSLKLEQLRPLLDLQNCRFFSLQIGQTARELLKTSAPITDLTGEISNFADTAGYVASLDIVITVDTSVAHLAGAMGKPVWVLLPPIPDWRWLTSCEDSSWYPSMRLFRRGEDAGWSEVVGRVKDALMQWTEERSNV